VPVLYTVHRLLEPCGAVALIGHRVEGRPEPEGPRLPRIPEDEIVALVQDLVDDDPGPRLIGESKRATPHLYEADLRASLFGRCRTVYAPGRPDIVRDIDSVVAGYYSTSSRHRAASATRGGRSRPRCESCCGNARRRDCSGTGPVTRRSSWPRD